MSSPPKIQYSMLSAFQIKNPSHSKKNVVPSDFDQHGLPDPDQKPSHPHSFNSPLSRQVNAKSNTLGELTQTFVQMIRKAPDQSIEIDEASRQLNIQKRRIYDITNVLEGIGYIQKLGKNKMKWVGGQRGSELQNQANDLQRKHESIEMETKEIQNQIQNMKSQLLGLSNRNSQYNFLSIQDIITIMKSLQVTQVLMYAGQVGDQLENDSNPEKRTSQCTIESNTTQTKLFYCKLIDGHRLEVAENVSFAEQQSQQNQSMFREKTNTQLQMNLYDNFSNDIFQESSEQNNMFPVTPELNHHHDFILNLPTFALSPTMERHERRDRRREQDIFENDSS